MPNLVNEFLMRDLEQSFESMGSCIVVSFNTLTVEQDQALRTQFRDAGVRYQVVKNRLAVRALKARDLDLKAAFKGKCAVVFAPEEKAIAAAKLVREFTKKMKAPPVVVTGGVIEGVPVSGPEAAFIADMPDRNTVNTQIVTAIMGPARMLATVTSAVGGGLARCLQAKIDKDGGE